ncbi:MAG: DUF2812 domain-containing protein [Alistipes sp.]|nr:DUF2812 domain-containing protein [Alistipes sp.]
MATTNIKKVWNFFTIAQWEEEEQWLNSMARNGWNLVRIDFLVRYVFERGTAGEYLYKLDLPDNLEHGMDEQQYCDFLKECGIDVVCRLKQWLFLRKKAADGPFNEKGDNLSRLKMTNKAYDYAIRILSTLLRVFTLLLCGVILLQTVVTDFELSAILEGVMIGIGIGALIAVTVVWVPLLNRLRKKMNKLVEETTINN